MVQFTKQWDGFSLIFEWGQEFARRKTDGYWLVELSISNMGNIFVTISTGTFEYCRTNSVGLFRYSKGFYWNIISNKLLNSYSLFGFNGVAFLLFSPSDCSGYKFIFGKMLHEEFLSEEYL